MEEKLLILLETKAFGELTVQEKAFVLSHISEQEYNEQHNILSISKAIILEDISCGNPDKIMFNRVLNVEKHQGLFTRIFNYKISLSRVAVVFFVAFSGYYLILNHIYDNNKQVEKIIVNNTDTVYKTKKIYKTDTVYLTKYKTKIIKQNCNNNDVIADVEPEKKISKQQFENYKQKVLYEINNNSNNKDYRGKNATKLYNTINNNYISFVDNVFVGTIKQ